MATSKLSKLFSVKLVFILFVLTFNLRLFVSVSFSRCFRVISLGISGLLLEFTVLLSGLGPGDYTLKMLDYSNI